jgi:predicted transcriptional regulator of viral defense system
MQPLAYLTRWLTHNSHQSLFTPKDLRALLPTLSDGAFKAVLSRAVKSGVLMRLCRGIYALPTSLPKDGLLLYHIAALLRADKFNYISLETALSDSGVISQIPFNWITLMSSGRSAVIACGEFGSIEFIHTTQKPETIKDKLTYDSRCGLWRASVPLALQDMKHTKRSMDLIDWEMANDFI